MSISKKRYSAIAFACFTIQAVGVGVFVTYGVFFNSLLDEFQWPRAIISGASSIAFFLSGLFAIGVGRLNDLYGPKILMSIASIFFGTGFLLMSQISEIWHLYLFYGVIFGIGLSGIDVIALTTTARWFTRSRGLMTGLVKVGTGVGQFSIPFFTSLLILQYGWRQTYVILGAFALISLLLVAQILSRDPEKEVPEGTQPKETDFSKPHHQTNSGLSAKEALKTPQLWLLCSITLLTVYCLITILVHIVPHASDLGLSTVQAAGVLSTIGAISIIGRVLCGVTIDRFGCKTIMFVCFLVLLTSLLIVQITTSLEMLYIFAAVYGVAHGGFYTVISPIVVEIFGLAAHGTIFGLVVFSGTTGGSIGPLVAGQIFDMTNSYSIVFIILTILSITLLVLTTRLKPVFQAGQS